jgi:hypothetical protein
LFFAWNPHGSSEEQAKTGFVHTMKKNIL